MAKEERVIPAARWLDVMYEQTQYLIDHAHMRESGVPQGVRGLPAAARPRACATATIPQGRRGGGPVSQLRGEK